MEEAPTTALSGRYRDVVLDASGRVVRDRGWRSNAIVGDFRRLLATLVRGTPSATALVGLQVGAGLSAWDDTGPPPATSGQTALVDPHPFSVTGASVQMDFLTGGTVSAAPTNRLQVQATLGPGIPPWPDGGNHVSGNLREFGLVATLDGPTVLAQLRHPSRHRQGPREHGRCGPIWLTF